MAVDVCLYFINVLHQHSKQQTQGKHKLLIEKKEKKKKKQETACKDEKEELNSKKKIERKKERKIPGEFVCHF